MIKPRPGTDDPGTLRPGTLLPGILTTRGQTETNPLILVVEDDPLQQSLMRHALERHGYRTDVADDGLAAVQRLCTGQYSLALLDYHLPSVDGVEAARRLREIMPDHQRPKLIAVTGDVEAVRERTETDGLFDAMFEKPLRLDALLDLVDDHLRSAARETSSRRAAAMAGLRSSRRRGLC